MNVDRNTGEIANDITKALTALEHAKTTIYALQDDLTEMHKLLDSLDICRLCGAMPMTVNCNNANCS